MSKELVKKTMNPLALNPQLFTTAMRQLPPQLPYESGILDTIVDRFRRGRESKRAELDANIAEHNLKAFKAQVEIMKGIATFQDDIYTHLKKNEHIRKMMELKEEEKKMDIQAKYYDTKLTEMEYLTRKKEWDKEYGTEQD